MSLIIVWTLSNPFGMWNDTTTPQNIAVPQQRIYLAEVGIMQSIPQVRRNIPLQIVDAFSYVLQ